ncbi:MAG: hypothetical protein O2955_14810 [Planctomycetota bacterium]|nr:hypothetical protein [Planctomycetota bacterium]MDA1213784.1 hypothetical protein [Planctomycetota bacterium]
MKRWHQEQARTYREWRKHYLRHVETNLFGGQTRVGKSPFDVDCVCDQQVGRFRKIKANDCGNTKCTICHRHKYPFRQKTRRECIAELVLKEELKEMNG